MGYNGGGAATGGGLAATGAMTATTYLWIGSAMLTAGFLILAVSKLLPRRTR